jgi:hypothetical protein
LQILKGERYRLNVIVSELRSASAVDYQTALVAFINCIIISTAQLKDRIRIRNEFIGENEFRPGHSPSHATVAPLVPFVPVFTRNPLKE